MKVLSVSQIREADAYTIDHEPISSIDLMERAGLALAQHIMDFAGEDAETFLILSGQGNNGGDGLVIARVLHQHGYSVTVVVPWLNASGSPDFETNLQRLNQCGILEVRVRDALELPDLTGFDVVLDALFGSGLTRPVTGVMAGVIERVNAGNAVVISIDIPSGLFADHYTDPQQGAIIRADFTFYIELPKLVMLLPGSFEFTGFCFKVPIGLHPDYIGRAQTRNWVFTLDDARELFMPRSRVSHKGSYGHALLLAGSRSRMGAALLAAEGALRSGTGLLTAALPEGAVTAMNARLPEAMLLQDPESEFLTVLPELSPYSAVGAGPGLGMAPETQSVIFKLLQQCERPLVMDADALNILAENPDWLGMMPAGTILTPHPKEFERLAGKTGNDFQRLEMAVAFAKKYQCVIVLKSAFTVVVSPDGDCSFNLTGNAGLAKGGSGDVLTGIILGLLCRGYANEDAARLAVYLHARAAELAAESTGLDAMLASDVIHELRAAWRELE
jgi:ADP-dependent NAD(P)H-hydrate dehydratase / NAD(P)H-hydrate epimerase